MYLRRCRGGGPSLRQPLASGPVPAGGKRAYQEEIPNQLVQYSFVSTQSQEIQMVFCQEVDLSSKLEKRFKMLHQWMTKGISHGEMATWDTNDDTMIKDIKPLGRQYSFLHCKSRKVYFVILFVVDGVSFHESTDSDKNGFTKVL
uniref:Uncharacterized protein n=1 Tax=Arundo donax TaxID=35708 RepID=A0A0A9DCA6_ARUDO